MSVPTTWQEKVRFVITTTLITVFVLTSGILLGQRHIDASRKAVADRCKSAAKYAGTWQVVSKTDAYMSYSDPTGRHRWVETKRRAGYALILRNKAGRQFETCAIYNIAPLWDDIQEDDWVVLEPRLPADPIFRISPVPSVWTVMSWEEACFLRPKKL